MYNNIGEPVGIGTLITAGTIGFSIQFAFQIGRYNSENVNHMDLLDLYRNFVGDNLEVAKSAE